MNWYWAVICRYTIQKFIKVIISKTIIFSRHIFGIIASMIYGSSRPRPRGESGVSSHRKYMIEKYMGKIWIKIQFHLTVSNTSEPESNAHICSQGAGCQVTSGLKSTWSLFPIIVKEIRTSDKEAETHIFRGLGGNNSQTPRQWIRFWTCNERLYSGGFRFGNWAWKFDAGLKRARASLRHSTLQFTRGRVDLNDNDWIRFTGWDGQQSEQGPLLRAFKWTAKKTRE